MKPWSAYVRVSRVAGRDKQGDSYGSPKVQEREIRRFARQQGWTIDRVVVEEDVSGGRRVQDRELGRLIERAERGEIAGIVTLNVSRFARSVLEGAQAIHRLDAAGAVLADTVGNNSRSNRLVIDVLLALAEEELRQRRATWARSVERAQAQGKYIARVPPTGYIRRDEAEGLPYRDARLVPDPERAPLVRQAFESRAAGGRVLDAARLMGVSLPSARRLLKNRVFLGEVAGVVCHEPIVSVELFDAVGATLNTGRRFTKTEPAGLVSRLVCCASCGRPMRDQRGKAGVWSYSCGSRPRGIECSAPAAALVRLVDAHVVALVEEAGRDGLIVQAFASRRSAWEQARDAVAAAEQRLERTLDVALELEDRDLARRRVREAQSAVQAARAALWALDSPLPEDVEAERAWLAVIASVTVSKQRRRGQPISERVAVTWTS